MSEWGTRGVARTVCLLALAASAWTGCGQDGDGPVRQPAPLTPAAPQAPLVPGVVPEGFVVEGASMGEAVDDGDRALLIGPADGELGPGAGPVIVVGQSDGSASMAGPSTAGGEVVDEPGAPDSFHPVIVDDGPWTWVIFHDEMCLDDCRFYVAGRDVARDDLIAVARGATYEDAGPVVDPEAVPNGMAPLFTAEPADGIVTYRGSSIRLLSSDGSGQIELQQVDGVPELASLWGFWVDDAQGTPIRGGTGWSGPVGATYEGGDHGRVWVEDGSVVAVIGWDVTGAELDRFIEGLRPGTPDDLTALGDEVVARAPTPEESMCGSTVISGPVEDSRWIVSLNHRAPDGFEACTEMVTAAGVGAGGGISYGTLDPVGSLMVRVSRIAGGPVEGAYLYGVAPPGTATVELAAADGVAHPLQVSGAGPRDAGERWFATFETALVGGETVIARAADGSELARAPADG